MFFVAILNSFLICCPMTKHLLTEKNFQSRRVLSSVMSNVECRGINSYMHKFVITVSPFFLLPKGKCKCNRLCGGVKLFACALIC